MGGYGSGRGGYYPKATTESQHRVDIRWLKKHRYLRPGCSGRLYWTQGGEETGSINYEIENGYMILSYRYRPVGGDWEDVKYEILFDHTPCNYGGSRKWFLCPRCRRRIPILYGTGKYFLCRHCHNLTHASQQERARSTHEEDS